MEGASHMLRYIIVSNAKLDHSIFVLKFKTIGLFNVENRFASDDVACTSDSTTYN